MEEKIELWEICVPCVRNDGRPIKTRFHRVWDKKVREIAGGLTVLTPAKGQWFFKDKLYSERVIPVRIACTRSQIDQISDLTAEHYEQLAIFYYKVSDTVVIKHYENHQSQSSS